MKLTLMDITVEVIVRAAYFVIGLLFIPVAGLILLATWPFGRVTVALGVLYGAPLLATLGALLCVATAVLFMLFGPGVVKRRRQRGSGQLDVIRATSTFYYDESPDGEAGGQVPVATADARQGASNAVREDNG